MKKILAILLGIFLMASLSAQNPGDLDLNYGTDGISVPDYPMRNYIRDISIMSDDKLVSGGFYETGSGDHRILSYKFNTDGSLAPFSSSTWFEYEFGYETEEIYATYVLPDDKILLTGSYFNSGGLISYVMRLLPDGTLDASFGTGGISSVEIIDIKPLDIGVHYGLSGDYSIYICGYTTDIDIEPAILKLDQDGQIATSFGTDGIFVMTGDYAAFTSIYLYSLSGSGYIYACGYDLDGLGVFITKQDINTAEFIPSFNGDGICNVSPPTGINPWTSALVFHSTMSENTITIFGDYEHDGGDVDIFAIRVNCADGSLDDSFGVGGWSSLRVAGSDETMKDAILQNTDGKYYYGGFSNFSGDNDFMIGRINNNGFHDPAFGDAGIVLTDFSTYDNLYGLALNNDESRLYACGYIHDSDYMGMVACYHTGLEVGISASESNDFEISVYPNPAQDLIHINTGLEGNYLIEILSPDGKLIMQERKAGKDLHMNIDHLEKGIYFLNLSNDNNHQTKKIIKQ